MQFLAKDRYRETLFSSLGRNVAYSDRWISAAETEFPKNGVFGQFGKPFRMFPLSFSNDGFDRWAVSTRISCGFSLRLRGREERLQNEHGINNPCIGYKVSGTSLCNRGLRCVSMLSSLRRVLAGCSMCLSKASTQCDRPWIRFQ